MEHQADLHQTFILRSIAARLVNPFITAQAFSAVICCHALSPLCLERRRRLRPNRRTPTEKEVGRSNCHPSHFSHFPKSSFLSKQGSVGFQVGIQTEPLTPRQERSLQSLPWHHEVAQTLEGSFQLGLKAVAVEQRELVAQISQTVVGDRREWERTVDDVVSR